MLLVLVSLLSLSLCQDPAPGWLSYAAYNAPGRITKAEAKWKVPANPASDGAFWSPWLGIESSDQLNLLQPVNPWMGSSWGAYVEYYQWQPTHNFDSNMFAVKAGDVMHGTAVYNAKDSTYTMGQSVVGGSAGQTVTVDLPIQTNSYGVPKNYTIVYLVMEKVWDCDQYSTDGQVTFYDIAVEIDGKPIENPKWITSYVEDNCNNRAKVLNSSAIQITWDQNM